MNEKAIQNKMSRQKRNINHFVEVAAGLLEQEGMPAMTIRNISDKAGYTSASIYKYFTDVEQLIAFGAIRCMRDFLRELSALQGQQGPFEKYLWMIYISARHSFLRTKVFDAVMIQRQIEPGAYFEPYYELYPDERVDLTPDAYTSFFADNYRARTTILLKQCAREQLLKPEDVPEVVDLVNMLYEGFVKRRPDDMCRYDEAYFMKMIQRVFVSFNPDLSARIEDVQAAIAQTNAQAIHKQRL